MDLQDVTSYDELAHCENEMMDDSDQLLELLRNNCLLKRRGRMCLNCHRRMKERPYGRDLRYGKVWKCTRCGKTVGLTAGSFFESSKLHPFTILKLAYAYLVLEVNRSALTLLLTKAPTVISIAEWMQSCRDVLSKDLKRELRDGKMGGPGKVIVIDEAALRKRLSHQGKQMTRGSFWLLGIYDVENSVGIVERIEYRSHECIIPIIEKHVAKDSEVVTDELKVYSCLEHRGYTHGAVGSYSNHIKGYFGRVKTFLKKRDVRKLESVSTYLEEFMWKERHRGNIWEDFLSAVKRQYRC